MRRTFKDLINNIILFKLYFWEKIKLLSLTFWLSWLSCCFSLQLLLITSCSSSWNYLEISSLFYFSHLNLYKKQKFQVIFIKSNILVVLPELFINSCSSYWNYLQISNYFYFYYLNLIKNQNYILLDPQLMYPIDLKLNYQFLLMTLFLTYQYLLNQIFSFYELSFLFSLAC